MTDTNYTLPLQRDVALFHDSFGRPNRINTSGPLPLDRITLRIGLLQEEGVKELRKALGKRDPIAVVDSLINTMYVALGALVEMGADYVPQTSPVACASDLDLNVLFVRRRNLAVNRVRLVQLRRAFEAQNTERSVQLLGIIVEAAQSTLRRAGIDSQPFFDEVQRANMSKLGANGRPVISRGMAVDGFPEGKVLKGPDYSPPDLAGLFRRLHGIGA
ncbi:hypothetical protein ANMWB30_23030 [Arthrobacter sp. MWB30]|nr:hypothetical protein ANMWB30_23030 [Arthrobacter sp. MWB30]